jgi:hypothetical protein
MNSTEEASEQQAKLGRKTRDNQAESITAEQGGVPDKTGRDFLEQSSVDQWEEVNERNNEREEFLVEDTTLPEEVTTIHETQEKASGKVKDIQSVIAGVEEDKRGEEENDVENRKRTGENATPKVMTIHERNEEEKVEEGT